MPIHTIWRLIFSPLPFFFALWSAPASAATLDHSLLPDSQTRQSIDILGYVETGYARLEDDTRRLLGSAIILHPGNIAMTAGHVVESVSGHVTLRRHSEFLTSAYVGYIDPTRDIALLCLDGTVRGSIKLGSNMIEAGIAIALGSSNSHDTRLSVGLIEQSDRSGHAHTGLLLRARPGYSGGPVVDPLGRLIGMLIEYSPDMPRARMVSTSALDSFLKQKKSACQG